MNLPRPRHSAFIVFSFILWPLAFGLLSPPPALAAAVNINPWWREDTTSQVKKVETGSAPNEVTAPRHTYFQTNTTFSAIGSGILDPTGQNTHAAVPTFGNAIALLTGNPPVQTSEYLAYMAGKAGFINQAYAQQRGGFDVLSPIQKLWIATRNIAYLITSLALVVIGFMIMLRKKIDAQTVIGVQQALPKLVVTLLLITFSYAIAGFLIDMIYFLIYFGIKLLALNGVFQPEPDGAGAAAIRTITHESVFGVGFRSIWGWNSQANPAGSAADAVGNLIGSIFGETSLVGAVGGLIGQPIAFLIFAVAILFAVFKLFWTLLMAYIQIILLTILGPLQLMLNALPGSDAFSKWFRNLLANTLAFPAAALMIVFAAALMGQSENEQWKISPDIGFTDQDTGVKWIPPLVFGEGSSTPGTTNPVDAIKALLGIGILLMTPKVVDMVKEWVQAPEFKYGSAIGEAVGFGGRAPGYITRTAGSGREYAEALRYSDPTSAHYDPNYLQQLMFTNPQLFTRVNRALSGGTRGRIIQGLGHTFGIGRK